MVSVGEIQATLCQVMRPKLDIIQCLCYKISYDVLNRCVNHSGLVNRDAIGAAQAVPVGSKIPFGSQINTARQVLYYIKGNLLS